MRLLKRFLWLLLFKDRQREIEWGEVQRERLLALLEYAHAELKHQDALLLDLAFKNSNMATDYLKVQEDLKEVLDKGTNNKKELRELILKHLKEKV